MIGCDFPEQPSGLSTLHRGSTSDRRPPTWEWLSGGGSAGGISTAVVLPERRMLYTIQHLRLDGGTMAVRLNITMDEDIYARLKQEVPPKKISAFISSAVRAKLHPDTKTLDAAYRAARKEPWRKQLEDDWKSTEGEGWPK